MASVGSALYLVGRVQFPNSATADFDPLVFFHQVGVTSFHNQPRKPVSLLANGPSGVVAEHVLMTFHPVLVAWMVANELAARRFSSRVHDASPYWAIMFTSFLSGLLYPILVILSRCHSLPCPDVLAHHYPIARHPISPAEELRGEKPNTDALAKQSRPRNYAPYW